MKKMICISLFVFTLLTGNAQDKFFFRVDFGPDHPILHSNLDQLVGDFDPPHKILHGYDAISGLYIGYSIKQNLGFESGVNYQVVSDRYTLIYKDSLESGILVATQAYIIVPANFYYQIHLLNSKFSVLPHIGVSYATRVKGHNISTLIKSDNPKFFTDTITSISSGSLKTYSILLNTGIGLEYRAYKRLGFTLNGNFSVGFNEMHRFNVIIKQDQGDDITGKLSYKGTHYYLVCGIKIYL